MFYMKRHDSNTEFPDKTFVTLVMYVTIVGWGDINRTLLFLEKKTENQETES